MLQLRVVYYSFSCHISCFESITYSSSMVGIGRYFIEEEKLSQLVNFNKFINDESL